MLHQFAFFWDNILKNDKFRIYICFSRQCQILKPVPSQPIIRDRSVSLSVQLFLEQTNRATSVSNISISKMIITQ